MNKIKQPLFHIVKRGDMPWHFAWCIRAAAIALALICCGIISTLVTSENPIQIYSTIIDGSFGSSRKFMVLLQNTAMLLCVALALTPAFKMRFWNIGGEGQALAGALAAAACMILMKDQPNWMVIPCMVITSLLAGAVWGAVPAFFKAKFGTNETLFTLMMNYVAIQLVAYFSVVWENPKGSGNIGVINPTSQIGWFPELFGSKYALNIIIVALVTIGMYIYLNYSKQGYEISVVGESERTARYIGIKVEKVVIRTMLISGAICRHRRWQRFHRRYGVLAWQIQPHLDDPDQLPFGFPGPWRGRNRHRLWLECLFWRYSYRHHSLLHHRLRVLHQLQAQPDQIF